MSAKTSRLKIWEDLKRSRVAYAYISPFYILFAIFGLFPIVMAVALSFFQWRGSGTLKFIGLENYRSLLFDPSDFGLALRNTVGIGIVGTFIVLFGGLVLAYIVNSKLVKFASIFKTVYFMPMLTSVVASSIVFRSIFNYNSGFINSIIEFMGFERIDWLGGTGDHFQIVIIILVAWQWIGWNMVMYLAGMQGINKDLIEAATIDGASHPNIFFRITLPLLKPIILFTLIQSTVGTFSLFTEPYMLAGNNGIAGGPGKKGLSALIFMLRSAPLTNSNYGKASAIAVVLCIIVVVVSVVFNVLFKERDSLY